jgi:energy-coupling factor transporter ATP-binding protein EcfA2
MEERITAVMTDPYVSLLDELGDRMVLLEDGEVAAEYGALNAEAIRRAGLRMPQMLRLSEAIGIDLPISVQDALPKVCELASVSATAHGAQHVERAEVVVAKGLTYTYPDGPTAIRGLDITLYRGEFLVILGANGSGKTTLALLLAQAMPADSGEILIEGVPMDFACHRGCIAYVFQEPSNQMVTMKVADELAFGPQQLEWDGEDVQQAVEREAARFGLELERTPLHLSPADARKLAIAANLTMAPQVIILDEPTNNLDERDTRQLVAHLQALRANGTTVVAITHDVELACEHADRVIVMHAGEVLIEGPPRKVMARPDVLQESDVIVPPVVALSLALCPDQPPALTVEELAAWIQDAAPS